MSDTVELSSFLFGLFVGLIIGSIFTLLFLVTPLQHEAINRGYAEMKLLDRFSSTAVFTWKDTLK